MSKFLVQGRGNPNPNLSPDPNSNLKPHPNPDPYPDPNPNPDGGKFLNRLSTANVNGSVDTITYTQWLNESGRMQGDVTVEFPYPTP